jgi:integrin beta 3
VGAAPVGSASVGAASVGSASVGAASVGSASVGAASVGSASVGSASVGSASVGAASASAASVGAASVGAASVGAASSTDSGESRAPGATAAARPSVAPVSPAAEPADGKRDASDVPQNDEGGLLGKLRSRRQLRLVSLMSLAGLVLLVLPAFFGIRAMSSDPVFDSLNALRVPDWAATKIEDHQGSGNPWCIMECRFRERIAESDRSFQDTTQAYSTALTEAGWKQWKVADCPETQINDGEGAYTCWRRDELTLDLHVSLPGCAVEQVLAEAGSEAAVEGQAAPETCEGSTVNIMVQNTISDQRGKTDKAPGPLGVTPDPVLPTDDPLLEPTPEAS